MGEGSTNDAVLLNSFLIEEKRCRVYLYRGTLIWETERPRYKRCTLSLTDILAVEPVHHSTPHNGPRSCCNEQDPLVFEHSPVERIKSLSAVSLQHVAFTIHYAEAITKQRWRHRHVTLKHSDPRQVSSWLRTLRNLLREFKYRPKRILIFVNPFGGKRRGVQIYDKQVAPLLALAGVLSTLVVTKAAHHAHDLLQSTPLDSLDGIVCVGGDGTFAEVLTGLLLRSARDASLDLSAGDLPCPPNLRLAVIPAGSTDTVAYSIHGTNDVETAVLHIILGGNRGMDVFSVRELVNEEDATGNLIGFTTSLLSYGYLGDVIRDSEKFRWMGPRRYNYSGFKKFIRNRGYEGEVLLKVCENKHCPVSNPKEGPRCEVGCIKCQLYCERQQQTCAEWRTVQGRFFMVNGANLSCACRRSPNGIAPFCHMGNGCVDVVLVRHTSLFNNLKLLLRLSSTTQSLYDLPFVEIYRAHSFSFIATNARSACSLNRCKSRWNCDGELLRNCNVEVKVHQQLVQIFARSKAASPTLSVATSHQPS